MTDVVLVRSRARARRVAVAVALILPLPSSLFPQGAPRGKAVYDRWCAGCHGDTGEGDGPAASRMLPRPRDFTRGVYKIRTTASGEIPTDADLLHVVEQGMPGTAMPEWRTQLSERERRDVIAYVKSLSTFFGDQAAQPIEIGRDPGGGDRAIDDGRATYKKLECFKCHGQDGRGDGKSAPTLKDDWGHPIRAADLTESWRFRGGNTVEAIYARLRTGLDGTPMPSFADAIEQKLITDEQLWHVAAYVRSLSPDAPETREVVRAGLASALPASPDDRGWEQAPRYWVPVVGQVITRPRWFAPTVDGVWVQALHDGRRLALRLTWHDPSRSPDPAWDEWLGRVTSTMDSADGAPATRQGPDRLALEFPVHPSEEGERPYFLAGSARHPVHVWRWTSAPDRVDVGAEQGLGTFAPAAAGGDAGAAVAHSARFANGEWRLQLVRALFPRDTARTPAFTPGLAIPMALYVADGSNGEDDVRGAVSAWYAIHLDVPTPARVYAAPAATVLLTAALGGLLVTRAQRRGRDDGQPRREDSR